MPRWYAGFSCVGRANVIVQQIGTRVRMDDLGQYIPNVRLEKRARKQFYLFVGVESPVVGELPAETKTLFQLPALQSPLDKTFTLEDIRRMTGPEMDVHDYARLLPYSRPRPLLDEDPFDARPMAENDFHVEQAVEQSQRYDRLLQWLSAVGSGSWSLFRAACRELSLDQEGTASRTILRRLKILGHVETSRDGGHWSVAPPVLAQTYSGGERTTYALCGQRDEFMLATLSRDADVEIIPQEGGAAPATIRVSTDDSERLHADLATIDNTADIVLDAAAAHLAEVLPSLAGWTDSLQALSGIAPHLFDLKRFDHGVFIDTVFQGETGLYEFWPPTVNGPTQRPKYTLFYDGNSPGGRWLRGEWYGLRFLALQSLGKSCPARYDGASNRFAIPDEWRWPEIYERALVLASGQLPARKGGWLVYEAISRQQLDALGPKLRLQVEEE